MVFSVREEVFMGEQQVSHEEEFDEFEEISRHFVAIGLQGEALGCSRWRYTEKGIKLERFAVRKPFRGAGVGSALVQATLADIRAMAGEGVFLYLHAQLDAVSLYEKSGFVKQGDQFLECDIWHYKMSRSS